MPASTCPCCHEEVTLPSGASPRAQVRCPLCQEEFTLSVVLQRMPPELIVVDHHATVVEGEPAGVAQSAPSFPLDADQIPAPAFRFEEGSAPGRSSSATVTAVPRPRRRPRSAAREIVKIVAGGILGLSIGQLILWWIPGNWQVPQRDPLEIGRRLGRYVPWIVPPQVRAASDMGQLREGTSDERGDGWNQEAVVGRALRQALPSASRSDARAARSTASNNRRRPSDPPRQPGNDAPSSQPVPQPPDANAGPGQFSAAQLQQAIRRVQLAAKQREQADAEQSRELDVQFYESLAHLGEVVTFADHTDPEARQSLAMVRDMLLVIAARADQRELVARGGSGWLKPDVRTNPGVLLDGVVQETRPAGELFETQLQLSNATSVALVSRKHPGLAAQTAVLVMGAIVKQPSPLLSGYSGDAAGPVVYLGLPVALEAPASEAAEQQQAESLPTRSTDADAVPSSPEGELPTEAGGSDADPDPHPDPAEDPT